MPELMDSLLTLIEENEGFRTALGFRKSGKVKGTKGTGLTAKDVNLKLARVLIDHESGQWSKNSPLELENTIRQRIVTYGTYPLALIVLNLHL